MNLTILATLIIMLINNTMNFLIMYMNNFDHLNVLLLLMSPIPSLGLSQFNQFMIDYHVDEDFSQF